MLLTALACLAALGCLAGLVIAKLHRSPSRPAACPADGPPAGTPTPSRVCRSEPAAVGRGLVAGGRGLSRRHQRLRRDGRPGRDQAGAHRQRRQADDRVRDLAGPSRCPRTDQVRISRSSRRRPPQYPSQVADGDSLVAVAAGETLTERQALEALLLPSSDNMAWILARWTPAARLRSQPR